ncbi:hypothetical protein LOD99_3684 [Oopsacas minuta]|uniref:HAT C-terminal dimerisation domain-containing protein n=1 Tax=Oopsacas minuta TaxID=111878 RepID=A0AAV7JY67_9METZ|nr:hypothetical protein LOD99_3684 [Oopsacas minuta]
MKRIYGKMPAEKVLELLERILIEFNIELQKHIVSITCDGAPVMVKMGRLSRIHQQLCLAHGVHLAVVTVLYSKNRIPIYDEGTDEEPIGTSQIQSTISDSYNDGLCGAEDTEETSEDIEDVEIRSSPILLAEQLKRAIQNSTTHVRTPKEDIGFLSLIKEMALFEATGDKSKNIPSIEEVLNTIPPTSVEAERAFSAAGLFVTKLRSRLSENSVDSLMILKSYFKKQEIK